MQLVVGASPDSDRAIIGKVTELYAGGDPWRAGSWYERRKRAVVTASLPREHYRIAPHPR